ncbi:hypothetical protein [Pseudofrankia sp. DC12]|uniref:hypothetical protein n=1 Tax=Pseudofrankia sp. DC12 TaxID=683315 RepID=UPI0005F8687D|nr:hypothetical protein [Pseudofrankia sp. DC12]
MSFEDLTPDELDAARVELFRTVGSVVDSPRDDAMRALRYRAALGNLADAVNLHLSFPDSAWTPRRVREGLAMAAAIDADEPGRVSLAIWMAGPGSAGRYGTPEERRARLTELRAAKADDLTRAQRRLADAPADDDVWPVCDLWAARVATLTDELARIDAALTPDSSVPSSLAGAA